jgi:hypothetical protein
MVTRIYKSRRQLYLREHREAAEVSAEQMGLSLDPPIDGRSVYRIEREWRRCDPIMQQQWAYRLGLEPEDLWSLPGNPSLNAMVAEAPAAVKLEAVAAVQKIATRRR